MIFRYLPAIIVDFLSYSSHPEGKSVEACSWIFDEKVNLIEGSAILNKKKDKYLWVKNDDKKQIFMIDVAI